MLERWWRSERERGGKRDKENERDWREREREVFGFACMGKSLTFAYMRRISSLILCAVSMTICLRMDMIVYGGFFSVWHPMFWSQGWPTHSHAQKHTHKQSHSHSHTHTHARTHTHPRTRTHRLTPTPFRALIWIKCVLKMALFAWPSAVSDKCIGPNTGAEY